MAKRREASYGPVLTDRQRKALEKEIAMFNEKETLAEIERASQYRPSKEHETVDALDNLNLSEEDAISFERPPYDPQIEQAKGEIDAILSHRQRQVWRMCMRQGKSQEEAADILHISQPNVSRYLEQATMKIKKHFKGDQQ